jgi:hypothetical protein
VEFEEEANASFSMCNASAMYTLDIPVRAVLNRSFYTRTVDTSVQAAQIQKYSENLLSGN